MADRKYSFPLWTVGEIDQNGKTQLSPIAREGFPVRMLAVLDNQEDTEYMIREAEMTGCIALVMRTLEHALKVTDYFQKIGVKYVADDPCERYGPFKPVPIEDFVAAIKRIGGDP